MRGRRGEPEAGILNYFGPNRSHSKEILVQLRHLYLPRRLPGGLSALRVPARFLHAALHRGLGRREGGEENLSERNETQSGVGTAQLLLPEPGSSRGALGWSLVGIFLVTGVEQPVQRKRDI